MYGEDLEGRLFLGCFGSIFASLFRGIIRIRGTWIAMSPMLQGRRPMSGLKLSLVSSIMLRWVNGRGMLVPSGFASLLYV